MNKTILFLLSITIQSCFSQEDIDTSSFYYAFNGEITANQYIGTLESPELNVLYRGYPNKITPAVQNNNGLQPQIYGSGCAISYHKDHYIVRVGRADSVIIALTLRDKDSTIPILRKTYRVINLPAPDLYWGNVRSGHRTNTKTKNLTAKYSDDGIYLDANFSVTSWTMEGSNKNFSGLGGDLSSALSFLSALENNTTVVIKAVVQGPDGINRELSGVWIINN